MACVICRIFDEGNKTYFYGFRLSKLLKLHVSPRHLQHWERDVGGDAAGRVAGGAGVDAHVGRHHLGTRYLQDLVRVGLGDHVDAALSGGLSTFYWF